MLVVQEHIRSLWDARCQGPGGGAAHAEWGAEAKRFLGLLGPKGVVRASAEGRALLQELTRKGALLSLCNPGGWCAPGWAAQPQMESVRPEHVIIALAAVALGHIPVAGLARGEFAVPALLRRLARPKPPPPRNPANDAILCPYLTRD
jgi:hypothetical protein